MPDSVGGAFPRNINIGHQHLDIRDGFVYRYLGDVPTDPLNWVIVGGAAAADPDTTGWSTRQDGALWFNKTTNVFRSWDGTQIVTVGGGSPGGSNVLRMPYKFIGTEVSVGFGVNGEAYFIVPAAGTITKWAIIIGSVVLPDIADMQLYFDPFSAFTLVDSLIVSAAVSNTKFERVVSQAVAAGDVLLVYHANTLNPAAHAIKISGYIDFTPS